jgi:Arc/MetJ-type ribon-helix-helix transcriptional regulator
VNQQPLGENPLARRRDNVFRRTEEVQQPDPAPTDTTAPAEAQAVENRIQFVLSPRHLQILDDLCYHTRRGTGYKLNRSEVVRILVELLGEKEVDHQRIRSEDDFRKYLHELFNS